MTCAVSVLDVSKRYGAVTVLDNVRFDVAEGEVVALLGPSGAGKSTILRCMNHLDTISAGQIRLYDEILGYTERDAALHELSDASLSLQRRRIGMVFQSFNLFRHMTALGNVMSGPVHVLGTPKAVARPAAEALLAKVGLADKAGSYPSQLSGGQQQRVAIARALAMEPRVMLLDEPTSALDPELAGEVVQTIRALAAEGQTMMIATHDMTIAREVADRVIFMVSGQVVEDGPSGSFFSAPRSERARTFLSRLNAA